MTGVTCSGHKLNASFFHVPPLPHLFPSYLLSDTPLPSTSPFTSSLSPPSPPSLSPPLPLSFPSPPPPPLFPLPLPLPPLNPPPPPVPLPLLYPPSLIISQLEDLIYPTALSPYIRFGCLSVRSFLCRVKELVKLDPMFEDLCKEVTSKLLQREFYFIVSSQASQKLLFWGIILPPCTYLWEGGQNISGVQIWRILRLLIPPSLSIAGRI